MAPDDGAGEAARLVLVAEDFAEKGWRARPGPAEGHPPADPVLDALLAAGPGDESVVAAADSPLFLRPPARLAYSSAAVFADDRVAADACGVVASGDFAAVFARAVAADVVVAPGGAELLGSHTRPLDVAGASPGTLAVAHRTTFGGATAEHVVPVHVDLVVLARARRLLLAWLADGPEPFPDPGRDHLLARLLSRLEGRA